MPAPGAHEVLARYRAGGADLPFGRPERAHGGPFEGYYWRLVHPGSGHVVVALCAICRDARGAWGMATLAVHPGGFVRTAQTASARADAGGLGVTLEDAFRAGPGGLRVDLGPDARLDVTFADPVAWPRRAWGGLGPAQALPGLPQYWHPVLLGAAVSGNLELGGRTIALDGALAYAEKNWGHAFPGHWWWGQAAFAGGESAVCFAGGRVSLLGAAVAPTAVVVRLGVEVLRLSPPGARTRAALGEGHWRLRTRAPGLDVDLEGEARGAVAHTLMVPVPSERRVEPRSHQHLAGRIALTVRRGRRVAYRGTSELAGLERGVPVSRGAPAASPR